MSDRLSGFGPLTWLRRRGGGGRLVDVLVAAAVAVPVFVPFATAPDVTPFGVVFNLGTVVPLVWRRRAPFAIALVVACFAMGVSLHHRPGQMLQYGALVAIYTLADLGRHRWQRWGFIGVVVASIPPGALLVKNNDAGEFMFTLLLPMTAFLLGTLARTARERSNALVERSAQLEREREALERERQAEAARAAAEERARIARDMHDVLAHAVSLMVVQAEAGPVVVHTDPGQAERVFDAIADAGRDAMAQLRRTLGVLKEEQDHGVRAPQPTIDALPGLVEHVNRTQVHVRLTVEGERRDLPADADLAAYRIVQEALTNTVKHAGARAAEVLLRWTDHELEITVTDDGQGHGGADPGWRRGGDGLIGIGERAAACGGTAEAGPLPGGGFRVSATLPCAAAVAA
ncbi:histidine kinase [Actinomadura sp. NPDC048955]|uniref:histidine kinase n=2 Tax=Actinomadura luteofluorescens TaxID=46163 RepID=A0A7Y9JHA9_9ACTN|nr:MULTISPECIES: histidine kinase [Actinomadura]MCR3745287.1 Signal transduction histidine kinase [Actinomadura glauciflava]NYD48850.1 signal transduction histidine kinase [Actinomadura luteofluorescens]